jgi:hypothetical protein
MRLRPITLRVQPPVPVGEVIMLPAILTGRAEADAARAIAAALAAAEAPNAAAISKRLRRSFLLGPLSKRLVALAGPMKRWRR